MSGRAFGVEIECYPPLDMVQYTENEDVEHTEGRYAYCDCIECVGPQVGLGECDEIVGEFLRNNKFKGWADLVTIDESLDEHGVEIKSPVLVGSEGFRELKAMFALLNKTGFTIDEECGMHVHHDAPEFIRNTDLIIKLVKSWMANQQLINNMVDPNRIDNTYCEPWDEEHLHELYEFANDRGYETHRGSINVANLWDSYGTIEIRQHEGTLNFEEAVAWIRFGQKFIDSVLTRNAPLKAYTDEEIMLRNLRVQESARNFISRKVARNKALKVYPRRIG